jgi:hypothetical protein
MARVFDVEAAAIKGVALYLLSVAAATKIATILYTDLSLFSVTYKGL